MASESNIRVIIFSTFIKIFQFLSKHVTASVGEPNLVIQPARRACALRALGLLLADGTPTVGGGKTF